MPQQQKLVLIVEDDPFAHKALVRICKMKGWNTESAYSVREAMDHIKRRPCCVILDLMLPDGSGEQVLSEIRRQNVPSYVIVATGSQDNARLEQVRQMNPDLLMRKPVNACELLDAMSRKMT